MDGALVDVTGRDSELTTDILLAAGAMLTM